MQLDRIINLLNNVDPFSRQISNHTVIRKEVLRRRRKGFFSKYDNITIKHYDESCDFFDLHIKALDIFKTGYDHFIHRINIKHINSVIKCIKSDKSLGEWNFCPEPNNCFGSMKYYELTDKERNKLQDSHGSNYVNTKDNKFEISQDINVDNKQFFIYKKYDGQGHTTIKICKNCDYKQLLQDGGFFTFSQKSIDAYSITLDDEISSFERDDYFEKNPHLEIAHFESTFRDSFPHFNGGLNRKEDILDMTDEQQKNYFLNVRDTYVDGELFSITFNNFSGVNEPLCYAINGTGFIFINYHDYHNKYAIRKTKNFVMDYIYENDEMNSLGISTGYDYKQNLIDAKHIQSKLKWY